MDQFDSTGQISGERPAGRFGPVRAFVRTRPGRLVAVSAATGLAGLIGVGVAAAQTSGGGSTTTTPANPPAAGAQPAPAPAPGPGPKVGRGGGPGHGFAFGKGGFGPGIHGEETVPDGNGGWRTIAHQVGEVTATSSSKITVKSADGFSRDYTVDEGTEVDAGRDGIADVKKGDTVRVQAIVTGSTAKAVDIVDTTTLDALRQQYEPKKPAANGSSVTKPKKTA